ncbi:MAG: ArsR family transcriptional regulator, partial [Armatimonadota bacterium]|nr:ArsR family transcriptional regulator [Armatimonadota bacterium]
MRTQFLSRFTPSLMPAEALEAIFVQRERLARRTVELVRDSVLTEAKSHTLFVGPRGIGKTHLVSLIYHR